MYCINCGDTNIDVSEQEPNDVTVLRGNDKSPEQPNIVKGVVLECSDCSCQMLNLSELS